MKKFTIPLFVAAVAIITIGVKWGISDDTKSERERRALVDTRIDNNNYWKKMAEKGLTVLNPEVEVPPAVFKGSTIKATRVREDDSPDVPVTEVNSTQSENSIFVDPNDKSIVLNSNNSTQNPVGTLYGANDFFSFDQGESWGGEIYGAGENNSGDPTTSISLDGRWFVNYIDGGGNYGGMGISYSDDQGQTWTPVFIASNPGSLADKNHMWIDNSPTSDYEGNLYVAWTDFGGSNNNDIVISRSTDAGESWSPKVNLSQGINAGSHSQGVNISTGPNGEVYVVWTIYDGWPQDEKAIGMARSLDGGETWEPAVRIIEDIRGIRNSDVPQNMRVNSFPSAAVDCSNGSTRGNVYVVWTNIGVPGENTGNDRDVYLIRSTDDGDSWSEPIRVNQDEIGQGKAHYLPWIAVDPSNGVVSVIFYDNRNTNANQAEAWVAVSSDAGVNWEDFRVSDVAFTPSPIPGLAGGYFGDYLSITALDGKVYPCWTDNRSGAAMTYVSPFETVIITAPEFLMANVNHETGDCVLSWDYEPGSIPIEEFQIYRDDELIGTSIEPTYADVLTEYGYYSYSVVAYYGDEIYSEPAMKNTQFGSSVIVNDPAIISANVLVNSTVTKPMYLKNEGVLDLEFLLFPFKSNTKTSYVKASGGGDEFIKKVSIGNIENTSASDHYSDFSSMYSVVESGNSYAIRVTNGNGYKGDQCKVWVDWNNDGQYNESAVELLANDTYSEFSGEITVPKGSAQSLTGMRVRIAGPGELAAYGDTEYGETEDYALLIIDWLSMDPEEGLVAVGDTALVNLTFDATDLELGRYDYNLRLITNDIENGIFVIPIVMHVTDLQVTASSEVSEICQGEAIQLTAAGAGGTGTYTYEWSSIPEGFTSVEQSPMATATENTTFIVTINDGELAMTDSVDITVFSKPEVDLGTDQVLCDESEFELDAGNPGATYLWSTGDTTQSITASGEGMNSFWVEVINENNCSASDTMTIDFATSPVVELGADTIICHNTSITLDAGNPGASYMWSTGETTKTIMIDAEDYDYGDYDFSVQVTNESGCENTGDITVEIRDCTSIDENQQLINMQVFPNPNKGVFTINLNTKSAQPVSIRIVDLTGKTVYEAVDVNILNTHTVEIDLSDLADGVYNIFVIGEKGITDKKVVIQK
ncbi:T9SS type A sorting domain-containing protein [bacterium]|nr:T9SS type A sorting domain-containing protein [bacterium]